VILFGVLYVGLFLSYFTLLKNQIMGTRWVLFLIFTVWAGDTSAYFAGTLIGRHRLYPKLSPKKSVEGLFGGLAGSIAVALVFRRLFLTDLMPFHAVIMGASILLLGQMGDLGESMIKRSANVKDSSRLIPGHGGVLDRLDSFLFSAPFLYYYVQWLQK
jgi:phosphatidate cytidylyltransferase